MAPITTAHPSPDATPSPTAVVAIVATMPTAMGDLLHLDLVVAFQDSRIRLVQFIENSVTVALGNTGNRAAGSGYARKRNCPRNAKHSSEK
ncbi:hypothetical protein LB568_31905 [Mesorhizobium sp. B263B2A]|nr:hypothetical protein [Mesorhizobium sp. B263B2A]